MTKKPPKIPGCASCPWGSLKSDKTFVPLEQAENPNVILVLNHVRSHQSEKHRAQMLADWCQELDVRPVIVSAAQCTNLESPVADVVKQCREACVSPVLEQYPSLPIVTMGEVALTSLLGGNRTLSEHLYKAHIRGSHLVQHTYGIEDWWSFEDEHMAAHISTVLASSVRPFQDELPGPKWVVEGVPMDQHLRDLFKQPALGVDIEIDVPADAREREEFFPYPWEGGDLVWLGITDGTWYYLIPKADALASPLLRQLMAGYGGTIYGHNVKGDLTFLAAEGLEAPKARVHDTMLWHTTAPKRSRLSVSLKWLAKQRYGASAYEAYVHTEWDRGIKTSQMPELIKPYLTLDLHYHWRLFEEQCKKNHELSFLLAMDYLPAVREMELNGIAVNRELLRNNVANFRADLVNRVLDIQDLAKQHREAYLEAVYAGVKAKDPKRLEKRKLELAEEFDATGVNLKSPAQVKAFFKATGLDIDATNEAVLSQHADHPSASNLIEIRSLNKRLDTNCYDYLRRIDHPGGDGLIHAQYAVSGAETTRLRCRNPNMQNVEGLLRPMFISRYLGGKLLVSDLSAIEYRIIAHVSQDPRLMQLFIDGVDIHTDAAARVFGIRPEQVTKEQRKIGKTFNFAGVYGAGPEKIFSVIGKEDMKLYWKVQKLYPGVARWKDRLLDKLYDTKRIENCLGQWWEFDCAITPAIEREAINRVIQSAGHSILVAYRLAVQDEYTQAHAEGILQHLPLMVQEGHDAFVDDLHPDIVTLTREIVQHQAGDLNGIISDAFGVELDVPITAEVQVLDHWE